MQGGDIGLQQTNVLSSLTDVFYNVPLGRLSADLPVQLQLHPKGPEDPQGRSCFSSRALLLSGDLGSLLCRKDLQLTARFPGLLLF